MLKNLNKIFFFTLALLTSGLVNAQSTSDNNTPKDNSPYSRLGLGDLVNQNFSGSLGMGGLGASFNDYYQTNVINPASYASLLSTSFEVGMFAQYSNLTNGTDEFDVWSGNINYLSIAFPMRNPLNELLDRKRRDVHWGMNLALLPYSTVGYNVQARSNIPEEDIDVVNTFSGRGGTYEVQWGNAVNYKDISVGLNLGYFFGKIINERNVQLIDSDATYTDNFLDEISLGGVIWDAGVQYKLKFKVKNDKGELVDGKKSITFGLYGNSNHTVNTNTSQFYTRRSTLISSIRDTIVNISDVDGEATLPSTFGIGVMYENINKMRIGFDYSSSQWSNYTNDAKPETLANSFRMAAGLEYIPNDNSYNSYFKRVRYRVGAFYENDPRIINEQLTNYGITIGLGFPVILPRQQQSFVNVAFELGQFGSDQFLKETYAQMTVGFTLNDNSWFFKRKFN